MARGTGGRARITPGKAKLQQYIKEGLTQQEMADRWLEESGHRVSRQAINIAINQTYKLTHHNPRPRYRETVPWNVADRHSRTSCARLLRLEGRRLRGEVLTPREARFVENWRRRLEEWGAVIDYEPAHPQGFIFVQRKPSDGDSMIRRPEGATP